MSNIEILKIVNKRIVQNYFQHNTYLAYCQAFVTKFHLRVLLIFYFSFAQNRSKKGKSA